MPKIAYILGILDWGITKVVGIVMTSNVLLVCVIFAMTISRLCNVECYDD
jgi:hypothetical protein